MSIATEFESTRENVQKAYTSLNKLGETATNKNIENISGLVDSIYSRLPKTSYQEGTNINLGKTLKAVVQYEDDKVLYGDTSQETTTGSNIIGLTTTQCPVTLIAGDKITMKNTSDTAFTMNFYTNLGDTARIDYWTVNSGQTRTITVGYDTGAIAWNGNITNGLAWANKGETIQDYEKYTGGIPSPNPNYPQPISVVTGTQEVVVRGKNLLKLANESKTDRGITGTITNYNELTWSGTPTTTWCDIIERQSLFLKAGTYKFSINQATPNGERIQLLFYKDSTTSATTYTIWGGQTNVTCTFTDDITEVRGALANLTSGTATNVSVKMQIEEGSTATSYEPYITPTTYQVHLGSLELAKIGTYQDYIYFDVDEGKWYKSCEIKKINVTSNKRWTTSNNGYWWYFFDNDLTPTSNSPILCTHFIKTGFGNAIERILPNYICEGNSINGLIGITTASFENLNALKTFLDNNNVYAYGILETPTTEEITDTTLIQDLDNIYAMMSVEGTTIIEVSGNLPAPIKVRAVKGE